MISVEKLKKPQSEEEIKNHWIYTDKVYISCVCTTYNQEAYIADTIDSMLAQQTQYKFEIVIHDDCSTDKTKDIILKYKENYPTIIKIIIQEENQYSKGKRVIPLAVQEARGVYIALCEGDDFWIDSSKIQKQLEIISSNNEYNIVITKSIALYNNDKCSYFCDLGHSIKFIDFANCIIGPKCDFYPTATFFFKKNIMQSLPEWFYTVAPVGDYYIQLFASYNKGCIYLPTATAVYRRDAIGSWTSSSSYKSSVKDRKARLVCNSLIRNTLHLNKEQLLALNKRYCLYRKDLSLIFLNNGYYMDFIVNTLKGLAKHPFLYTKTNIIAIISKLKKHTIM